MNVNQIPKADISALIETYRGAARQHGDATEKGDYETANKSAKLIEAIYSELRRRGPEAQRQLRPLLTDSAQGVRLWAGSHALEFAPTEGEPVLIRLTAEGRLVGLDAERTLQEWRGGRLRFP